GAGARARPNAPRRLRPRPRDHGRRLAPVAVPAAPLRGGRPRPPRRAGEREPAGAAVALGRADAARPPRTPSRIARIAFVVTGTVAVIVKGYPRLSETFIAQEIL